MHKIRRVALALIALLGVLDLALCLGVVRFEWFSSLPIGTYLLGVWDAISLWCGRAITAGAIVVPLLVFIVRKSFPTERKWQEVVASVFATISPWRNRPTIVFPTLSLLLAISIWLTYILCIFHPMHQVPASRIVITSDGSHINIYLITDNSQKHGNILYGDVTTPDQQPWIINVGGTPDSMLVGPRTGFIYILDVQGRNVRAINPRRNNATVAVYQCTGQVPTSMVLTPDERKLYISNQKPIYHASITVIDLKDEKHPSHSIDGFNCPQSLGILRDGSKLYLATQCGSSLDPVFVIDTRTDKVIRSIEGFAVGSELAVAGKEENVYVSRSKFTWCDKRGHPVEEPARISVIDPEKDESVEARTIKGGGSGLTTSPDGRYLFYSTSTSIEILNTETQATRSIGLCCAATGITVRRPDPEKPSLRLYAWLPAQDRIFVTGLDALLP